MKKARMVRKRHTDTSETASNSGAYAASSQAHTARTNASHAAKSGTQPVSVTTPNAHASGGGSDDSNQDTFHEAVALANAAQPVAMVFGSPEDPLIYHLLPGQNPAHGTGMLCESHLVGPSFVTPVPSHRRQLTDQLHVIGASLDDMTFLDPESQGGWAQQPWPPSFPGSARMSGISIVGSFGGSIPGSYGAGFGAYLGANSLRGRFHDDPGTYLDGM